MQKYIKDTVIGDSKLRDRARIFQHHVQQREHEELFLSKHTQTSAANVN